MRGTAPLARVIALAAIVAAAAFAAVVLLGGGGGGYTVKARFENASQIVKGNLVQVSGHAGRQGQDIQLTPDGQAELTLSIDDDYAPLRRGTLATVRQASLSGVANRYIDLRLPGDQRADDPRRRRARPGRPRRPRSTSTRSSTRSTRRPAHDLQQVIKGSANQHTRPAARQMNAGLLYLNPSLQASSRLFRELNSDSELLERFVVSSSQLVTDLADRHEDLAGLVDHLATTTNAIGAEQQALADSVAAAAGRSCAAPTRRS